MWKKILLGIIAFIVIVIVLAFMLTKTISEVGNKQLLALSQGDIITAYAYTSKEFRAEVSLAAFEEYVKHYPILKGNKGATWSEREYNNGTGTLKGSLIAESDVTVPIEYHFVKENDDWKIQNMLIKQPANMQIQEKEAPVTHESINSSHEVSQAAGEIYQVLVSDQPGVSGSVDANKAIIAATSPKVYVSVYILHAQAGLKVIAEFVRLKNGAKIGPSVATVTKNGDIIRDFSFTNTASKWPAGKYRVNVTTSNDQSTSVDFTIR